MVRLFSLFFYHLLHLLIKLCSLYELFEGEVHTIAPVVAWIGRDIDALGIGISKTKVGICCKPVLEREDAEH